MQQTHQPSPDGNVHHSDTLTTNTSPEFSEGLRQPRANSAWMNTRLEFSDGTEVPRSSIRNEFHFLLFDLGVWEEERRLSSLFFKIKLYQNSGCLSVSGLQVPEGAAGPTGSERFADSPEHLQVLLNAALAGDWDAVFPNEMVQHNRSSSISRRHGDQVHYWSARTRTVSNALFEHMGHSKEYLPWHQYKDRWQEILALTPGELLPNLRVVDSRYPELGPITLWREQGSCWIGERSFSGLPTDWFEPKGSAGNEARIIVPTAHLKVQDPFGGCRNPNSQANLAESYMHRTKSDPRHRDHATWLKEVGKERVRNKAQSYLENYTSHAQKPGCQDLVNYLLQV
jgi:hypothetical protein